MKIGFDHDKYTRMQSERILERIGDVEAESCVAAGVAAGLHIVHPDVGPPVHGAEVQQDALSLPTFRQGEGPLVPQVVVCPDGPSDAGKARFNAERDEDLTIDFPVGLPDGQHGVVPQAVEVHPLFALHQRTRVFGQGCGRVHLVGPGGTDAVARRLPGLRRGVETAGQAEKQEKICRFCFATSASAISCAFCKDIT